MEDNNENPFSVEEAGRKFFEGISLQAAKPSHSGGFRINGVRGNAAERVADLIIPWMIPREADAPSSQGAICASGNRPAASGLFDNCEGPSLGFGHAGMRD